VVGLGLGQGGFVQHDLGHNSGFKHASKYNYPWQIVAFNIMIGASAGWWRGRHNRHHAFPNHEDVDLDMRTLPLFAWDDDQLCRAYQKGLKNVKYQHWYFTFFGPPLVFILYRVLLTQWLIRTRSWAEIGAVTFYWIWSAAVLLPKMEYQILPFVIWQLIKLLVSGTYLGWVFALNHTPFPVVKGKKMNWVEQTCATTQNIVPASENSPWTQLWLDWFSGHLNYQVEHHLFPGMPRCNYSKLKPLLQPLLKKHDVPYHEANFFQAVGQVFEALRKTAETGIKKAAKSPVTIQERRKIQ
jgi:fatty acid desaturase